jgi:uncharacterized protein YlxW (UPF0749 family)
VSEVSELTSGSSRSWRIAAPLALAACGLLLVVSARAADGEDLRGSGHAQLGDLVRAAEDRTTELSGTLDRLHSEVNELTESQPGGALSRKQQELEELEAVAGLSPMEGPGLTVALDDAPRSAGPQVLAPGFLPEDYIVHQQDLEAVINAMWAGGAEAMMVMDQRIISTSSVKCIGSVLYLQGRRYAPPYTVSAIGDVNAMLIALDASPELDTYRSLSQQIGLGFELTVEDNITMPPYEGSLGVSPETAA